MFELTGGSRSAEDEQPPEQVDVLAPFELVGGSALDHQASPCDTLGFSELHTISPDAPGRTDSIRGRAAQAPGEERSASQRHVSDDSTRANNAPEALEDADGSRTWAKQGRGMQLKVDIPVDPADAAKDGILVLRKAPAGREGIGIDPSSPAPQRAPALAGGFYCSEKAGSISEIGHLPVQDSQSPGTASTRAPEHSSLGGAVLLMEQQRRSASGTGKQPTMPEVFFLSPQAVEEAGVPQCLDFGMDEEKENSMHWQAVEAQAAHRKLLQACAAKHGAHVGEVEAWKLAEQRRAENSLWAAMTLVEADHMRRLLDGFEIFHEQLAQNEDVVADLETLVAQKEQACRRVRHRVQKAEQDSHLAGERLIAKEEEISHWRKKQLQCEGAATDHEVLSTSHAALARDVARLQEVLPPMLEERQDLRGRLSSCEERTSQQVTQLQTLQARCQQEATSLRSEQLAQVAELRAKQKGEFSKADTIRRREVSSQHAAHIEALSELQAALQEAALGRERQRLALDEASDRFYTQRSEGAKLQQSSADAKLEVMELSARVKSLTAARRARGSKRFSRSSSSASVLLGADRRGDRGGELSTLSDRLDSSIFGEQLNSSIASQAAGDADAEFRDLRQKTKSLEQQCAKMHSALEKGQAACERWRRRGLNRSSSHSGLLNISNVSCTSHASNVICTGARTPQVVSVPATPLVSVPTSPHESAVFPPSLVLPPTETLAAGMVPVSPHVLSN